MAFISNEHPYSWVPFLVAEFELIFLIFFYSCLAVSELSRACKRQFPTMIKRNVKTIGQDSIVHIWCQRNYAEIGKTKWFQRDCKHAMSIKWTIRPLPYWNMKYLGFLVMFSDRRSGWIFYILVNFTFPRITPFFVVWFQQTDYCVKNWIIVAQKRIVHRIFSFFCHLMFEWIINCYYDIVFCRLTKV